MKGLNKERQKGSDRGLKLEVIHIKIVSDVEDNPRADSEEKIGETIMEAVWRRKVSRKRGKYTIKMIISQEDSNY